MVINRKIILSGVVIVVIGTVIPFVPYLALMEMFCLIPFALIFVATFINLIKSFINKSAKTREALYIFSILPIFIFSQILSCFTIHKIQRYRSNKIIVEIENSKSQNRLLPQKYDMNFGIEYIKMENQERFLIKYSRGFLVTEEYDSERKSWKSYGWND